MIHRIYARKMKTYAHIEVYMQLFTVTWFMITPNWKQPKCLSADEWINKLLQAHNATLSSNNKEQATSTKASWVHLKHSSWGKDTRLNSIISLLRLSGKGKTVRIKNRSLIVRARVLGRGSTTKGPREFWEGMEMFYTLIVLVAQHTCWPQLIELYTKIGKF